MRIAGLGCPKCGRGLMPDTHMPRFDEDGLCSDKDACQKWTALIAKRPDIQAEQERRRGLWMQAHVGLDGLMAEEQELGAAFDSAYDAALDARRKGLPTEMLDRLDMQAKAALDIYWQAVCALGNARDYAYRAALARDARIKQDAPEQG